MIKCRFQTYFDLLLQVNGIKSFSLLLGLHPSFDVVKGVVVDYMHGILLGIVKTMLYLWLEASQHKNYHRETGTYPVYYIGHLVRQEGCS